MCTYFTLHYVCGHSHISHRCPHSTTSNGGCEIKSYLEQDWEDDCMKCRVANGRNPGVATGLYELAERLGVKGEPTGQEKGFGTGLIGSAGEEHGGLGHQGDDIEDRLREAFRYDQERQMAGMMTSYGSPQGLVDGNALLFNRPTPRTTRKPANVFSGEDMSSSHILMHNGMGNEPTDGNKALEAYRPPRKQARPNSGTTNASGRSHIKGRAAAMVNEEVHAEGELVSGLEKRHGGKDGNIRTSARGKSQRLNTSRVTCYSAYSRDTWK
ncbi:hypothetical protein P280DRAFT_465371 [Massarina eburnea CBS 473.64]|uniref:Uncharacterized protein n=1 Tax=Massarina eburnea CBS 473.64 TaxID=1395130 RepID=A0A6A6SCI2_9PLEO|nr:hypothetical protein P280DRAFT_465371 [Massarina eburnea CBS 473.64]